MASKRAFLRALIVQGTGLDAAGAEAYIRAAAEEAAADAAAAAAAAPKRGGALVGGEMSSHAAYAAASLAAIGPVLDDLRRRCTTELAPQQAAQEIARIASAVQSAAREVSDERPDPTLADVARQLASFRVGAGDWEAGLRRLDEQARRAIPPAKRISDANDAEIRVLVGGASATQTNAPMEPPRRANLPGRPRKPAAPALPAAHALPIAASAVPAPMLGGAGRAPRSRKPRVAPAPAPAAEDDEESRAAARALAEAMGVSGAGAPRAKRAGRAMPADHPLRARNAVVRRVMDEHKLSLAQASRYVSEHGLWRKA